MTISTRRCFHVERSTMKCVRNMGWTYSCAGMPFDAFVVNWTNTGEYHWRQRWRQQHQLTRRNVLSFDTRYFLDWSKKFILSFTHWRTFATHTTDGVPQWTTYPKRNVFSRIYWLYMWKTLALSFWCFFLSVNVIYVYLSVCKCVWDWEAAECVSENTSRRIQPSWMCQPIRRTVHPWHTERTIHNHSTTPILLTLALLTSNYFIFSAHSMGAQLSRRLGITSQERSP